MLPPAPIRLTDRRGHRGALPVVRGASRAWSVRGLASLSAATSSFGAKIAGFTALLLICILCLVTVWAVIVSRQRAVTQAGTQMAELAAEMASQLDRGMAARYRDMSIMAGLGPLRQVWTEDPKRIRSVLDALRSQFNYYAWIGVAAPDGVVRAATDGLMEGTSVAGRPWFKDGLSAQTVQDVHDGSQLAESLGPSRSSEPYRFVDFAAPLHNAQGETVGVLGAYLSWAWAADLRRDLLSGREAVEIEVADSDGNVILGKARGTQLSPAVMAEMNGFGGAFTRDGEEPTLDGYARTVGSGACPGFGWIVIAKRPLDVALEPVNRLIATIVFGGLAAAAIGIALALLLARHLSAPLRALTAAADEIGRGSDTLMLPRTLGSSEMVQLSTALRSLLRRAGTAELRSGELSQRAEDAERRHAAEICALEDIASRDPLTGVLNRRGLRAAGGQAMTAYRTSGKPFAVLVVDIDHFKRVNDRYGHAAGDLVIAEIATTLSRLRSADYAARIGGEEFVLVLHDVGPSQLSPLADRIRDDVKRATTRYHGQDIRVTASMGGALVQPGDRDLDDVVERADRALYTAKAAGRDTVRLSDEAHRPAVAA